MQVHTDKRPNSAGAFSSKLFRIEKITGLAVLGGILAYHLLRTFGFGPELPGIYGLFPLLLMFSGATLLLAGAASERRPAYAALLHAPLVIWLIIFALALS